MWSRPGARTRNDPGALNRRGLARPLRNPRVQGALARLTAAYLGWALSTIRWRSVGREAAEAIWDSGDGVIVCFWHSRILISPACWPLDRAQEPRALISLSADGEFIARAMERLGFPAIRGSSAKASDRAKAKGGEVAFRHTLNWLRAGGGIAITPDGPRGPAESMTEGPPMLAGVSGVPVLLVGLACAPCLRLRTWDRAVVPLPFARGAIVWDQPSPVAPRTPAAEIERLSRRWAERLTTATARAEAALGG